MFFIDLLICSDFIIMDDIAMRKKNDWYNDIRRFTREREKNKLRQRGNIFVSEFQNHFQDDDEQEQSHGSKTNTPRAQVS